jgi:hypothetical protein
MLHDARAASSGAAAMQAMRVAYREKSFIDEVSAIVVDCRAE